MNQLDWTIQPPTFDGADVDQDRDGARLTGQLQRIMEVIKTGNWYTLEALADLTGDPPASISAQLRNLRKERFGAHVIMKRYLDNGLYEYRLEA